MNCIDCYNLRTIRKSARPKGMENMMLARYVKEKLFDYNGEIRYFRMHPSSKKNAAFQQEYCEFWNDMDGEVNNDGTSK